MATITLFPVGEFTHGVKVAPEQLKPLVKGLNGAMWCEGLFSPITPGCIYSNPSPPPTDFRLGPEFFLRFLFLLQF